MSGRRATPGTGVGTCWRPPSAAARRSTRATAAATSAAPLPRRFLVLAALMFWQGGFTFYAGVVVPVGREVLGSDRDQGFITRQVTEYLNLAGGIAVAVLAWDVMAAADPSRPRRWTRTL